MKRIATTLMLVAALAGASAAQAQQLPLKLLVLPSPGTPEVFAGDGKTHVVYELLLANFTENTIRMNELDLGGEVRGGNLAEQQWLKLGRAALKPMFSSIAGKYLTPQEPVLKPGESGVIFLFLDNWDHQQWQNSLSIEAEGKPETRQNVTVGMGTSQTKPIIIGAPLRGKNWWTPNGPANDSIHRRTITAIGNHLGLPERFAVDWIQLGADGNSYRGSESDNRSYHCYDADILAVADGRVIATKDGIPENVPNSSKMAVPITLDTIGGNYVEEDLGDSRYAFYAHLIPGTVAVKVGDQVKRGQVLGKLGNSGNSTEPHLHFQICDAAQPLLCNGLPFEIDHFTRYDYKLEMKGEHPVKFEVGAPHQVTNEIFMNKDLGEFTPAGQ